MTLSTSCWPGRRPREARRARWPVGQLTQRLVERALEVALTDHLGYGPDHEPPGWGGEHTQRSDVKDAADRARAGRNPQNPRDRDGSFEPKLVRKRQRRFEGFDERILALYSRGMSTRDIEAHLRELYGVSVGRDLISRVTDAVIDDVREWQATARVTRSRGTAP
jgi:putative transposase